MNIIDWTTAPGPWRYLGPEIAKVLREVATEGPITGAATWCQSHGKRLREQRLARGMTQAGLLAAIGLPASIATKVSQWENGNVSPSPTALAMLKKIGFIV